MSKSNTTFLQNKSKSLFDITQSHYDLLVIGGGITGAGIALDAVKRGMKVLLVEKNDFASGTSSKSTKLIHGGLRYLKQLELQLVKEVGRERAIVHRNAPHIVLPEKMLLPIRKNGSLGYYPTSLGLLTYDFLAGVRSSEQRKMLTKERTKKLEPLVKSKNLIGGGLYFEYRTDDARLTIEVIKKAVSYGATCLNYTQVEDFIYEKDQVKGATIKNVFSEEVHDVKATKIINATGPWVDLLRKKDKSLKGKRLQLTKGVHVVVPYKKLPIRQAIYFDVGDGRMIFAIPRNKKTYIGTTDTVYNQDINRPLASKEDVAYIIDAVNQNFTKVNLAKSDIESSWAGLRPLIHEDGKSASELSRKDEIFESETGLLSIAGGKLTGYRKMAERIVDKVVDNMNQKGHSFGECMTETEKLSGGDFDHPRDITDYIIELTGKAKSLSISIEYIKEWVYRYGKNAGKILEIAKKNHLRWKNDIELLTICSELLYTIEHENVVTLSDFLIRRTSRLYFDRPKIKHYLDDINQLLQETLQMDKSLANDQLDEFIQSYKDAIEFG